MIVQTLLPQFNMLIQMHATVTYRITAFKIHSSPFLLSDVLPTNTFQAIAV